MVLRVDGLMAKERENLKLKTLRTISAWLSGIAGGVWLFRWVWLARGNWRPVWSRESEICADYRRRLPVTRLEAGLRGGLLASAATEFTMVRREDAANCDRGQRRR
jgi:hypothetical protein